MIPNDHNPLWYAVYTRSRYETIVNEILLKKKFDVFLPQNLVLSKRRDRKFMFKMPLFPGYLFVKTGLSALDHLEIVKTVGVVRLIGNRNIPTPVAARAVESLKIMAQGNNTLATGMGFKSGSQVIVVCGPLTGLTGTFVRYKGKNRVIVHVKELNQFAGVEVNEKDIELLS